jgi:cell division protease FtsH
MLPEEDRALWSKGQFEAMLAVMMGGQTAEGIPLGDITTGASNDLQNASNIARKMVTEFGMSDDLGPRAFGAGQGLIFLGKELAQGPNYSDDMASRIDSEIEKFLCKARDVATRILEGNRANLTRMAKRLISDETLDGPELQELLANSSPEPLPLAAGRRIGPLVAPLNASGGLSATGIGLQTAQGGRSLVSAGFATPFIVSTINLPASSHREGG